MEIMGFLQQDIGLKGLLDYQISFNIFIITAHIIYRADFTSAGY